MDKKGKMDDKGIPKELFEKDPRIKFVEPKPEENKPQTLVRQEVKTSGEKIAEEKAGEKVELQGEAKFTEPLAEELKAPRSAEEVEKELEEAPVVEVEESLEKITSLPTIEAPPAQVRPSQPPRYFEFEEESGQLVKRENVYEPQSYAISGTEDISRPDAKPANPLIWLAVIVLLLILVFLIYRFAF